MYAELDKIVNESEKILDEESRLDFLYDELEKLFGAQEFVLSQIACGYEGDFRIYVCVVSWVNEEGEPEQGVYRMYIKEE